MTDQPFTPSYKPEPTKKPRPMPKLKKKAAATNAMPVIDLSKVPDDLLFMTFEGFKDQAREFARHLDFVQPSSDREWVQRRFVDELGTWSHIERADEALGGMISEALSIIAKNPHFPPWWRSIAVSLARGNPNGVIRACQDVIAYKGTSQTSSSTDIVDKNFGDSKNVRLNVVPTEPLDFDVECPPSLPIELWSRIPREQRRDAIISMAQGLRRGIHPIDTIESFLLK